MDDALAHTDHYRFEPWSEFVRRHWPALPIAIAVAIATFFAVSVLTEPSSDGSGEAELRFGLTNEVVWPFYDPARDRVRRTLESESFRLEAEAAAQRNGGVLESLVVDTESGEAFIDLNVTASNGPAALEIVELAAEHALTESASALTERDRADLEEAERAAAETQARIDAYEAEIAELIDRERDARAILVEGEDASAEAERLDAEAQRRVLVSANDEANRELSRQTGEVTNSRSALETVRNEIEVLRAPTLIATEEEPSALLPFIAATVAALMALTAAISLIRRRSRVTSAWQISGGEQLPLMAFGHGVEDWDSTMAVLNRRIRGLFDADAPDGSVAIVATSEHHACTVAMAVAADLQESIGAEVAAHCLGVEGAMDPSEFTTEGRSVMGVSIDDPNIGYAAAADTTVLIVRGGSDRVIDVRRAAQTLRDRGASLAGVCVLQR